MFLGEKTKKYMEPRRLATDIFHLVIGKNIFLLGI